MSPAFGRVLFAILCLALAAGVFVPSHGARAAVGFVQGNTGSSGGLTSQISFAANNMRGNFIVVAVDVQSGQTASVADSSLNSYQQAVVTDDGSAIRIYTFFAQNIAGGANTVTVTRSSSVGVLYAAIHEYAGIATAGALDVTASSTGNSANLDSGPATTNFANELIFGWGQGGSVKSAGTGFMGRETFDGSFTLSEDRIATTVGSYRAQETISGSGQQWLMQMAAFIAASPGIQVSSRSDMLSDSRPACE